MLMKKSAINFTAMNSTSASTFHASTSRLDRAHSRTAPVACALLQCAQTHRVGESGALRPAIDDHTFPYGAPTSRKWHGNCFTVIAPW
jgi:hypothetical protein